MKHFEEELKKLKQEVTFLFSLVHKQLTKAQTALMERNTDLARDVIQTEKRVNAQELKIDQECEDYFALFNPVAVDLRYLLAVLKINSNLERTGDIAEGIARFVIDLKEPLDPELMQVCRLDSMYHAAVDIMDAIELAFEHEDPEAARRIFEKDEYLDEINRSANQVLAAYIRKKPENIEQALHALSVIRKLERVGDQAKNIAEEIIFYVEAKVLKHSKKL